VDKLPCQEYRKPPKQAQFPDTVGRAGTYASKLVMRLGQRFESARRLSQIGLDKRKTRNAKGSHFEIKSPLRYHSQILLVDRAQTRDGA
jgi:hypothetical protein